MKEPSFDVETCSEEYKEYIRGAKYGDIVEQISNEYMIFIYRNKKHIVKFNLDFSYDFENGFNHTYFSNFSCSVNINNNLMETFQNCIKNNFVTEDRLSC
jgi:hypothetical protein